MDLVTKVLANKHNNMLASWGITKEMNVVADALRRVTVMTYTIRLTRGLDVKAGRIDRCSS